MGALINNVKTVWTGWSGGHRTAVVTLAVGVVISAVVLGVWVFRTDYQTLFAELDARDAGTIVEELKRMKVAYKVTDGGTRILVDENMVHETRLSLMGRGVPLSGGVGFEIFDNKDVGMTEYTQKINYQRALQGELARTIMSIEQVKQARVHLVVAETALFKRQNVKPKASVSLVLTPGASLAREQIAGIQRLVAAAVPGLEPSAVTLLDQGGVALSPASEEDESYTQASGKLRLKKNAEDYFIRKITGVLDRTFGPGQAIVSVDVTLNFDEVKRTEQTVMPVRAGASDEAGAVVRKRQSVYRDAKGAVTRTVNGNAAFDAASPALTSTTDVEYELGKAIEQVVSSPGGIRRINVGVIVPRMNMDQIQRVQDVVRMIVGYNEARGDGISVQPIDQFVERREAPAAQHIDAPAPVVSSGASEPQSWLVRLSAYPVSAVYSPVLLGLGLLFGMLTVAWWFRRHAKAGAPHSGGDARREARLAEIKSWLRAAHAKESV